MEQHLNLSPVESELLESIEKLNEQLEEKQQIILMKNQTIANLREEYDLKRMEMSNILDHVLSKVPNESNQTKIERNEKLLKRNTSALIPKPVVVDKDLFDECKQNLQHARAKLKELRHQYFALLLELRNIKEQAEDYYKKRVPIINPITKESINLDQFVKNKETNNTKNIENTEKINQNNDKNYCHSISPEKEHSSAIQLVVKLPNNEGKATFIMSANVTVEQAKKAIFHKKLPFLRPNQYFFGLSESETLQIENIKLIEAHESFYDLYSFQRPIKLHFFEKSKYKKQEKIEIASFNEEGKENNVNEAHSMKYEPKQVSQSESENIFVSCTDNEEDDLPYEKLSADHFPICFLTAESIPIIIFVPKDSTEDSIRELLKNQLRDTLNRLKSKQRIFFYQNGNEEFSPLHPFEKLIKHPSIQSYFNESKIPLASLGESSIFTNELPPSEKNVSPKNFNQKQNEKLSADDILTSPPSKGNSSWSVRKSTSLKHPIENFLNQNRKLCTSTDKQQKNPTLLMNSKLFLPKPNREAILVQFCYEDQKILLNLPRKANIDTIKRLVLQKFQNIHGIPPTRFVLKVTGTSYFITEGETNLEDLPIVQFCKKKSLTTMLSLITKEQSREEKIISSKIAHIIRDHSGQIVLSWNLKDTDATDFRIKMSRIMGDRQFNYANSIILNSTPYPPSSNIDNELSETFKICIFLNEKEYQNDVNDIDDIYSMDDVDEKKTFLHVNGSDSIREIIKCACEIFNNKYQLQLNENEYILRICGYKMYLPSNSRFDSFPFIRDCLIKKKITISLTLCKYDTNHSNSNKILLPKDFFCKIPINPILEDDSIFNSSTLDIFGNDQCVSLLELKNFFEFKLVDIKNLFEIGKKEGDLFFCSIGIYHGGILIDKKIMISKTIILSSNGILSWKQWIRSSLKLCEIPEDARICLTLYQKKDSTNIPVCNINICLFDFKDHFRTGKVSLKMWLDEEANPIGTCMENVRAENGKVPKIHISFHSYPMNVAFPNIKSNLLHFNCDSDSIIKPTQPELKVLRNLIDSDPLTRLNSSDKILIWNFREYLRLFEKPKSLVKILLCVEWKSIKQVYEIYRLLNLWNKIDPVDALQLLDAQFANRKVREFAVRSLDQLSDFELKDYLLQLIQTLKYEPNHFSPLGVWLLHRALQNQIYIGHHFFWLLKAELHIPEISERFSLLLEIYLRACSSQREDLLKQVEIINSLNDVAKAIKQVPSSRRKADLHERLAKLTLPETFQIPLDPL